MARVLVTGAAGFVGSHLVEALLARGDTVVGIDRKSIADARAKLPKSVWNDAKFTYVVCDFLEAPLSAALENLAGFNLVFHLAAEVGVANAVADGYGVMCRNVKLTTRVLDAFRGQLAKIIFTSSSEVYGTSERAMRETDSIVLPPPTDNRWGYTYGKAFDELRVLAHGGVVARPFNTIGPRQDVSGGAVLPSFVRALVHGEPVALHGDGSQVRAFTHVLDTVAGLLLLADRGARGGIYNVGSDFEVFSIRELYECIVTIVQSCRTIEDPWLATEPDASAARIGCARRVPDSTKLNGLGWHRSYNLREAVEALVTEFWE